MYNLDVPRAHILAFAFENRSVTATIEFPFHNAIRADRYKMQRAIVEKVSVSFVQLNNQQQHEGIKFQTFI